MSLVLFDVSNFIFRAYYSTPKDMVNDKNEPTNAIFGVANMMLDIIGKFSKSREMIFPVCCFDGKSSRKSRTDVDKTYKQNRQSVDDNLKVQFSGVKELIERMGIHMIEIDYKEADDVIASIVTQQQENFEEIIICSPDKDFCQLILKDHIKMYEPKKQIIINKTEFEEKYKIPMRLFTQYQALIGDQADNVKGVKGIGPKYAVEVINECDGNIYDYIKKQAKRSKLIESEIKNYELSLKMVTLEKDLNVDMNFEQFFHDSVKDNKLLKEYFYMQNFNKLLNKYYNVKKLKFIDED